MRKIDRGLVEHLNEPSTNLYLYGFLCIFEIQYTYSKSRSSSLFSIPNEVRTDLSVPSTADAEISVKSVCGVPRK